jgi:hypothetical protein
VRLEEQYKDDLELPAFLEKKLLEPGWAGELSPDEFAYVKCQLRQSPSLKRRWGFRPSAKRFSESRIRAVARNGLSANKKPVLASVAREQEPSKWDRSQKGQNPLLTDRKTGVSIR